MIGFVSDIHVGNHKRCGGAVVSGINERCRLILASLAAACREAVDRGCSDLFILGDLFDNVRPEPQVIAAVQSILDWGTLLPVHILVGNHDQVSTSNGDHALGPLAAGRVEIIQAPKVVTCGSAQVLAIPFRPGDSSEYIQKVIAENRVGRIGRMHAVAFHAGVWDDKTPPFLRSSSDSICVSKLTAAAAQAGYRYAFAGNWHNRRTWSLDGMTIMQVGALAPTGWDNPGPRGYGTLALWDEQSTRAVELAGPRFLASDSMDALLELAQMVPAGSTIYGRLTIRPGDPLPNKPDVFAALEFLIEDDPEVTAAARTGAAEARSADTLAQALFSYVGGMALPDGVDREQVLARTRKFLAI